MTNEMSIFEDELMDTTLSLIGGNAAELHVILYNFPCRKKKHGNQYHYRYRDFGNDFICELSEKQLSDFAAVASALAEGRKVTVPVKIADLPEIMVEIQGRPSKRSREFYSDLADAIVDAFDKYSIKP